MHKKNLGHFILIAAFSIVAMMPSYWSGVPVANDQAQHYQFAWTVYDSVRSGEIYPSLAGETNLHRMNALKNLAGACINGAGTITFIVGGRVAWRWALPMAAGAIAGGYGGAGAARHIGQANVRRVVVAIGFALAAWMLYQQATSALQTGAPPG